MTAVAEKRSKADGPPTAIFAAKGQSKWKEAHGLLRWVNSRVGTTDPQLFELTSERFGFALLSDEANTGFARKFSY